MAIPIAVGELLRLRIACFQANQLAVNTVHWTVEALTGSYTQESLADDFDGDLEGPYKAVMTNTASYYGVQLQRLAPDPVTASVSATSNIGIGTAGEDPLPGQVCGVIGAKTHVGGPGGRGRVYIPFPDNIFQVPLTNSPSAGYRTLLETIASRIYSPRTFVSGANSITLFPRLFHRATTTVTLIQEGDARQKWGTQRRRGNYGQANSYPPFE